jgi:hypothetical protein
VAAQFPGLPASVVYLVVGTCWALIFPQTVIMVTNSTVERVCEMSSDRNRGVEIPAIETQVRYLILRNGGHDYSHFDLATKPQFGPSSVVQ